MRSAVTSPLHSLALPSPKIDIFSSLVIKQTNGDIPVLYHTSANTSFYRYALSALAFQ